MSKTQVRWTPARKRPTYVTQIKRLYRGGKTPAEIAARTGITPRSVYRWLHVLADAGEIEPAGEEKTA
jgi:DNA-binding IclR family transcriptional regulator